MQEEKMHDQEWKERFADKVLKVKYIDFLQKCDFLVVSHEEAFEESFILKTLTLL